MARRRRHGGQQERDDPFCDLPGLLLSVPDNSPLSLGRKGEEGNEDRQAQPTFPASWHELIEPVDEVEPPHERIVALSTDSDTTTAASFALVAELSGYRTMPILNRQFLAEVGATPTAHRNLEFSQKPPAEGFSLGLHARRRRTHA